MGNKRISVIQKSDSYANIFYSCPHCGAEVVGSNSYFNRYSSTNPAVCPVCKENVVYDNLHIIDPTKFTLVNRSYYFDPNDDDPQIILKDDSADKTLEQGKGLLEVGVVLHKVFSTDPLDLYQPRINNAFKYLILKRQKDNRGSVEKTVALAERQPVAPLSVDSAIIKDNPEKLKQYIKHIIDLEAAVYSCKQRLGQLYIDRVVVIDDLEAQKKIWERSSGVNEREWVQRATQRLSDLMGGKIEAPYIAPTKPNAPEKPAYKQAGLFNKKKIQAENDIIKRTYEADCKRHESEMLKYEEDLKEYRQKVENWKNEQKEKEKKNIIAAQAALASAMTKAPVFVENEEKKLIDAEITKAEDTLKKLIKGKNELYALDVVYGKYRNFVALSSFYEYLMSGRCSSLEGANGAYNIYEAEIRANQVISQLSTIIQSLEQIKNNQYMVYSMLQSVNSELETLNSSASKALQAMEKTGSDISKIAQNSSMIAYNTAQTAYYAKKNTELTNALGYLIALK